MTRTWAAAMRVSLIATLGRPEWWAMALAGFLVRGGIVLVALPLVSLPTVAQISTAAAPTVETLVIGGETLSGALIGGLALAAVVIALILLGVAGAWFDLALARDTADDEDLELGWRPAHVPAIDALRIRLLAHIPTLVALTYGVIRVVALTYDELTSPSNGAVPVVSRVFDRAPDVIVVVLLAWLFGEAVGALAARRLAAGAGARSALLASARQVLRPRGLATLVATSAALLAIAIPFLLALGRTWEHLRTYLLEHVDAVPLAAAVVLLVGTWILGLSILGAALAWRASAWTVEAAEG
jgi:hypothetical protein